MAKQSDTDHLEKALSKLCKAATEYGRRFMCNEWSKDAPSAVTAEIEYPSGYSWNEEEITIPGFVEAGRIKIVDIKPTDALILETDPDVSDVDIASLKELAESRFGREVTVIGRGVRLTVLRNDPHDEPQVG